MRNNEGYPDPTAGKAIRNVNREQKSKVMHYDMQRRIVRCPKCRSDLTKYVKDRIRFCPWCTQKLN